MLLPQSSFFFKDADRYVGTLLDMFNRFSSVIEECFYNDPSFLTIRDIAYQSLVNDTTIFSVKMPDSLRLVMKFHCQWTTCLFLWKFDFCTI